MYKPRVIALVGLFLCCAAARAQDGLSGMPASLDKSDLLWVLISTALVLLMTPALALFYGGLVQRKNALSTMLQALVMMGAVTVIWFAVGFTIAYGKTSNGYIGTLEFVWGNGISMKSPYPYNTPVQSIPCGAFMLFQMMLAVLTPAIISGAVVERIKFGAFVTFACVWSLVIYAPIVCWVWNPDGWLFKRGLLDFAGGTVVHLTSGVAALAGAIALGRREVLKQKRPILPNNLTMTMLGAGLLWFGWIGLTAGSALSVGDVALTAFVNSQLAAAGGMLAWMVCEKIRYAKSTALGAASGVVAGLVGITPAAGFVSPGSALFIGVAAGVFCCVAVNIKGRFGFDDSLDVFGIHGVGGAIGILLTGVFASDTINPIVGDALTSAHGRVGLMVTQALAVLIIGLVTFVGTTLILRIVKAFAGLRVKPEEERAGLDLVHHGESGYNLAESGYTR